MCRTLLPDNGNLNAERSEKHCYNTGLIDPSIWNANIRLVARPLGRWGDEVAERAKALSILKTVVAVKKPFALNFVQDNINPTSILDRSLWSSYVALDDLAEILQPSLK